MEVIFQQGWVGGGTDEKKGMGHEMLWQVQCGKIKQGRGMAHV